MSSLAKDTGIKALEYLIIKLILDPNDVHVVEEIIKNTNVDIQAHREKLKLPATKYP